MSNMTHIFIFLKTMWKNATGILSYIPEDVSTAAWLELSKNICLKTYGRNK